MPIQCDNIHRVCRQVFWVGGVEQIAGILLDAALRNPSQAIELPHPDALDDTANLQGAKQCPIPKINARARESAS